MQKIIILLALGSIYNFMTLCFIQAFKKAEVNVLAPYKYSETVFGVTLDSIFFASTPNTTTLIYGLCILPSAIINSILEFKDKKIKHYKKHLD